MPSKEYDLIQRLLDMLHAEHHSDVFSQIVAHDIRHCSVCQLEREAEQWLATHRFCSDKTL